MEVNEELLMFGRTIHLSSDERDDYLKTIIEVSKGPKLPEQDIISLILAASKENSYLVDVGA
ncbi:MAG: hypothetical protein ABSB12_01865, partial [Candidatus Saccharimonadales bacterium]